MIRKSNAPWSSESTSAPVKINIRRSPLRYRAGPFGKKRHIASFSPSERRHHRRFSVKDGAFVVLRTGMDKIESIQNMSMGEIGLAVFKTKPNKIGKIKDMSESGLCFEYVCSADDCEIPRKLDILKAEGGFCLNDIDFKTISDTETMDSAPFEPVKTKQSGIQFVNLTRPQKEMLGRFLKKHTRQAG